MKYSEKKYNPKETLISIHIPKAGGSSLRNVLKQWYGEHLYLHYYDELNCKMPEKRALSSGICIHGHFNVRRGFGIVQYYPDARQFIMFLRDPFEILLSYYYYVKMREKSMISYRDGRPTYLPEDVNDFLRAELSNPLYTPNILDYLPERVTIKNFHSHINDKFIFIGFMDYYQQSLNCLADLLGFPRMQAPFENKSERFGDVDPALREAFINGHPLEYEVYNYAREKFLPLIQATQ